LFDLENYNVIFFEFNRINEKCPIFTAGFKRAWFLDFNNDVIFEGK